MGGSEGTPVHCEMGGQRVQVIVDNWVWQCQPGRQEKQVFQMLRAMTLQRLDPAFEFFLFRGERSRILVRLSGHLGQQGKRRARSGRRILQFHLDLCQRGILAGQTPENSHGVAQAGKNQRREKFFISQFPEAGAERQQMSRKVAAVHARHIKRLEWLEGTSFIPIEEVPAIPVQSLHGGQGILGALNQGAHRKIPHIPGAQIGQQRQAHIRGGGPRSGHRGGNFLKIVRRQPILPRGDKGFKEMPRLAGGASQKHHLLRSQIGCRAFYGLADAPGDPWRGEPQANRGQRQ